jgi:hypothetical protein
MPFALPIADLRSEALLSNQITAYAGPRPVWEHKQRNIALVVPQAGAASNQGNHFTF